MELDNSEELNKLVVLLFEKTGLSRCVPLITDEVEEELEGIHIRINPEEDDESSSTADYGGVVYHTFRAIENENFCALLDEELTKTEKSLLSQFLYNKELLISVERTYFSGQKWKLFLSIPFVLNKHDSETFSIMVKLKVNEYCSRLDVEARSLSEISKNKIESILTMYSLQL